MCHMAFGTFYAGCMRLCAPSWFPSLTDPAKKVPLDMSLLLFRMAPIAIMFSSAIESLILAIWYAAGNKEEEEEEDCRFVWQATLFPHH